MDFIQLQVIIFVFWPKMHSQIIETCWISVILVVAILIPAEIAN
jgi:hypothetical protein